MINIIINDNCSKNSSRNINPINQFSFTKSNNRKALPTFDTSLSQTEQDNLSNLQRPCHAQDTFFFFADSLKDTVTHKHPTRPSFLSTSSMQFYHTNLVNQKIVVIIKKK